LVSISHCYHESPRGELFFQTQCSFGQRSFSVSGPDAWNSLSRELRGITVASTFKRHFKAELFSRAYGVSD